jgi:RNA polymerase sigma-54 factor
MAISQRLELRQSQALVMTPQLMQAIKLLQLSNLELASYVDGELERNPLLEPAGEEGEAKDANSPAPADESAPAPSAQTGEAPDGAFDGEGGTTEERFDSDLGRDNAFPDEADPRAARTGPQAGQTPIGSSGSGGSDAREGGDYNLEAFVAAEVTLADHLAEQLALAVTDPVQRMIGRYLIDLVDEAGYLTGDLAAVAERLGCTVGDVETVLTTLQGFDPSGVCARNLSECLAIQLRERDRFDPAMRALVEHLDLLARRDFAALRRVCGVGDEDLTEMVAEIRALNPKPGLAFGSAQVQPVVPDVFVRTGPDGGWLIELNSETLPRVLVNQEYYAVLAKSARDAREKSYFSDCMQSATWLVRALDQRAKTILKVATEIVRQQDAFLAHGVQYLRPLNLKTVADAIGMHESTVSRVTANKYMAVNRGLFELKYFFTSPIAASDGGAAHSAEAVRHRIRQMIETEDPNDVLSDDTIVERLRGNGIEIARRTVAKYREAMRIPSSVQRRRQKQTAIRAAS